MEYLRLIDTAAWNIAAVLWKTAGMFVTNPYFLIIVAINGLGGIAIWAIKHR